MDSSKDLIWYWSLKPGLYVDALTGKDPYPDMVKSQWTGTIEGWNSTLIDVCISLAIEAFGKVDKDVILHIPDSINFRMTAPILSRWNGEIKRNNFIPFNNLLMQSGEKSAIINILNINSKGNLI